MAAAALVELDAPEPNRAPVHLLGGTIAFGGSWVVEIEGERNPENAAAMRPHVIARCQEPELRLHPALRIRCSCGRFLAYAALAPFATGVLVVTSPRLLPPTQRGGGVYDLASPLKSPLDPTRPWDLEAWEIYMASSDDAVVSSWKGPDPHPVLGAGASVIGDPAKRRIFRCRKCGATHTVHNVTLLRLVLQAIANGQREVHLADPARRVAAT